MAYFSTIIGIIISVILTDNIVLARSWGICPFLGVSKKTNSAIGMGLAVIFVVTVSTLLTFILYKYVMIPLGVGYLRIIISILVIAAFVQLLEIVLKRFSPVLYNAMGVYLPLITTNCVILRTTEDMLNNTVSYVNGGDLFQVLIYALFTGVGFLLALVLMSGAREKTQKAKIPESFKGFPIALLTAGLLALAFYGLSGISFI